jgi:hypothetical protein
MFVFIWDYLEMVTDRYHREGGLVVIAENITRALEMANAQGVVFLSDELKPDLCYEIECSEDAEAKVFIFPNAGCC